MSNINNKAGLTLVCFCTIIKVRIGIRIVYIVQLNLKELNFCHKLKSSFPSSDLNIFAIWWCKLLIFPTWIILSISINSLKYLRSTTLGYKDIEIRKSEIVAKTQFLYCKYNIWSGCKYNLFRNYCSSNNTFHSSKLRVY